MRRKSRVDRPLSRRQAIGLCLGAAAAPRAALAFQPRTPVASTDFRAGMHLVLTGAGAALPVPERGNAGAAIVVDGTVLQVDCGNRTMANLLVAGINPLKVEAMLFTHLHFDHMGEYGYFVVCSWIGGRQTPLKVYGPTGTVEMSKGAIHGAHHTDVTFITKRVQGLAGPPMKSALEPPVEVRDIAAGVVIENDRFKVTAAETDHIPFVGPTRSLAYRVESRYGSVVVSGDTAPCEAVIELSKGASILVHECTYPPPGLAKSGTFSRPPEGRGPGTGHTTPIELGKLAAKAGVKKLVATHFGLYTRWPAAIEMTANFFGPEGVGPEVWPAIVGEIRKNYDGPIVIAEDALVIRVGP